MKQDAKNNEPQGRTKYVPASVKVIELSSQRGICVLAGSVTNNPFGGDEEVW